MARKKTKKRSRRDNVKNPALDPVYNTKIRREFIDIDYVDQLSEEEKQWLNKFMEEYNNASLDYKNLENNLHNTPELKKDCTDRNNARNRCIYSIKKATNMVKDDLKGENDVRISNPELIEDAIIAEIDRKKNEEDF